MQKDWPRIALWLCIWIVFFLILGGLLVWFVNSFPGYGANIGKTAAGPQIVIGTMFFTWLALLIYLTSTKKKSMNKASALTALAIFSGLVTFGVVVFFIILMPTLSHGLS